ncbi:hypothetical protein KEG38_31380 [Polyangium jinanense]|uniref:hypothetical protein n=1 Tax=Polyangium jinanense TaxID=2829994 RepID=UPI002341932E|nr:hypothetical protein [Polyangium jinanense]MDC3958400.1 hypothetical protein [Polyangium jinanense]
MSLPELAAFEAARAQGFSEAAIVTAQGLDRNKLRAALAQWKITLAGDTALRATYEVELAQAEDRLTRRVPPLDENLEAWVAFLAVYAAHPAPFVLLRDLGLALPDLSRLGRLWARRLDAAPALRDRAARLTAETPPRALPAIRPAEPVLVPPKLARSEPPARASATPPRAEPEPRLPPPLLTLEQHASLTVELAMAPDKRPEILARYRLTPEQTFELDRHYERLVQTDASKHAAWHAAYRAYHAWLVSTGGRP